MSMADLLKNWFLQSCQNSSKEKTIELLDHQDVRLCFLAFKLFSFLFQFLWASDILLNKNPNRDDKQGKAGM